MTRTLKRDAARWLWVPMAVLAGGMSPAAALGNPASIFCTTSGGRLEMVATRQGQLGLCFLPNRRIVEEWTFFRDRKGGTKPDRSRGSGADR